VRVFTSVYASPLTCISLALHFCATCQLLFDQGDCSTKTPFTFR